VQHLFWSGFYFYILHIAQDDAKRRWMSQSLFERDDGIAAHVAVRCSSSLRINYIIMR
jgi:hypothetical protein